MNDKHLLKFSENNTMQNVCHIKKTVRFVLSVKYRYFWSNVNAAHVLNGDQ